jgi:dipeptidase E
MRKIVAIGGGELGSEGMLPIDREILRLAESPAPRALFVPTASSDSTDQCDKFRAVYGELGCSVDVLLLCARVPSRDELEETILTADIIYVGGGNTLRMLRLWRETGVDELLRAAGRRGAVLCGTSAGANCWFRFGLTDSLKFESPDDWTYTRAHGLELIEVNCCPHYHSERREEHFKNLIAQYGGLGIALDDHAALAVRNDEFRVVVGHSRAHAYRVFAEGLDVVVERIEPRQEFARLDELLLPHPSPLFTRQPRDAGRPHL